MNRQTDPLSGFLSDQGEPFNGRLRLVEVEGGGGWQVRLEISDAPAAMAAGASAVIGKCPECGGEIVDNPKSYGCGNWRDADGGCRFVIWKEIAKKWLTPDMAGELLSKGRIGPLDHFVSKKGNPFSAALKLVQEEGRWEVRFDFGDDAPEGAPRKAIGRCPVCGGEVTEGPKAYGCANWREADGGCKFVVWRTIAQKEITPTVAVQLLEKGESDLLTGFMSKKGAPFSARLRIDTGGPAPPRVVFDFTDV